MARKKYTLSERISYYRKRDLDFADGFKRNKEGALTQDEFKRYFAAYKKNSKAQYAHGYWRGAEGGRMSEGALEAEKKGFAAGQKALKKAKNIRF